MKAVSGLRRQKGVALVVGLLLLLVMTVVGVSSLKTVTMEERMSTNAYDRSLAFQAAEAALRVGEQTALSQSQTGNSGFVDGGLYTDNDDTACGSSSCQNGLCSQPDNNCAARWLDNGFNNWTNANVTLGSLAGTPEFFVEYLGDGFPCDPADFTNNLQCKRYRITARSTTTSGKSLVMLQSIYAAP